jgi:hypothetical protein
MAFIVSPFAGRGYARIPLGGVMYIWDISNVCFFAGAHDAQTCEMSQMSLRRSDHISGQISVTDGLIIRHAIAQRDALAHTPAARTADGVPAPVERCAEVVQAYRRRTVLLGPIQVLPV